ncbi:MAG TPA: DegV family protein [Candidatus Limnocylindria bacterium]|nr:DegV family protein [Candidatus Limnocylindria bacterium]
MDRYAVIVDGTAALPPELAHDLDIKIMPLHVLFGQESYTAGVDLTAEEFYARLRQPGAVPSTSQPSLGEATEGLQAAVRDGSRAAIAITVATEFSATHTTIVAAAQQMPVPVTVVDSRSVAGSIGLIATAVARARRSGASYEDAVALAQRLAGNVGLLAIIDTLEQLRRSGRASGMQAIFGSLLAIKPIVTIREGKLEPIDKVRTREKAMERLKSLLAERVPAGSRIHACTLHTNEPERARLFSEWLTGTYHCVEHFTAEAGAVIAAHGGPGIVGVCWYPEGTAKA